MRSHSDEGLDQCVSEAARVSSSLADAAARASASFFSAAWYVDSLVSLVPCFRLNALSLVWAVRSCATEVACYDVRLQFCKIEW